MSGQAAHPQKNSGLQAAWFESVPEGYWKHLPRPLTGPRPGVVRDLQTEQQVPAEGDYFKP